MAIDPSDFDPSDNVTIKIDKPHPPHGKHVDIIQPLSPDLPGIANTRIDPTGSILDTDFNIDGDKI